jgi:hypothetical protein
MSEDELVLFETKWKEIYTEGIERVFRIAEKRDNQNFDLNQYLKLYNIVSDICISKYSTIRVKCYERLIEIMRVYCTKIYQHIKNAHSSYIVVEFVKKWIAFEEIILRWTLKIFNYLVKYKFKIFSPAQI